MRVLLTVVAWIPISFLFTWLWGTAISRADDEGVSANGAGL
jgi:hypothetical protein